MSLNTQFDHPGTGEDPIPIDLNKKFALARSSRVCCFYVCENETPELLRKCCFGECISDQGGDVSANVLNCKMADTNLGSR